MNSGSRDRPDHGGRLDAARRRQPAARGPWLDLSTGINPWPYPVPPITPATWHRLPDDDAVAGAVAAARTYYGVSAERWVVAVPGSQAAIQWLPRLRPPGRVAVIGPTYGEHAYCWRRAGHDVELGTDLDEAQQRADVVILTNPNNPDGRMLSRTALRAAAAQLAEGGGWLVVDEAFADVAPHCTMAGAAHAPGLCVLRSFGKFFGLAGLRLGFAIADREIARPLEDALGPWAVSGPALEVGTRALADAAWTAETRARLSRAGGDLSALLDRHGFDAVGGTDLFRLVAHERAPTIAEELLKAGILVRHFPDHERWLRLGLPETAEDGDWLDRALGAIMAKF